MRKDTGNDKVNPLLLIDENGKEYSIWETPEREMTHMEITAGGKYEITYGEAE